MAARQRGVVVPITAEDNTARAFDSVNAQVEKLRAQVAELRAQAGAPGAALGAGMHSATTQVQATSAALRTLEGNPGIRAMERFLVTIPGVGAAFQAIFPAIGLLAIGDVVSHSIDKFLEMKKQIDNVGKAITKLYRDTHNEAQLANDELELSNDKLQNVNDKLEHKPQNNLAIALHEAWIEADKLAKAAGEALDKSTAALEKSHVSRAKEIFGEESTDAVEGTVTYYRAKIADAANALSDATHANDAAGIKKANEDIADAKRHYAEWISDQIKARTSIVHSDNAGIGDVDYALIHGKQDANLGILRGERTALGDQSTQQVEQHRAAVLGTHHASLEASATDGKLDQARQRLVDAQRKASEQAAQSEADIAKSKAGVALALLDDQHKRQLISDQDFYKQKAAIQSAALDREEAANYQKQGALGDELRAAVIKSGKDKGNPSEQLNDATHVVELQTQINALEDKRLGIVERRKQLDAETGTETFEALKKQTEESEKLAAEVEAIRGGSTSARRAQADSEYARARQGLAVNGASAGELGNLDYQHQVGDANIDLRGAEDIEGNANGAIAARRSAVKSQQSTGQISALQARRDLIELDKQEAAALQPVLEAYERLAALNVDGAAEKVEELKEKISELNAPVNEVASQMRNQFDSAFETLFENLDNGKKAWSNFWKDIQKDAMKDAYQQFVQPLVQGALGSVIPNGKGSSGVWTKSSILGGLIPGLAGNLPGIGSKLSGGGAINVTLINQGSPLQVGATSQQSSREDDESAKTISIILKDLDQGGLLAQALKL